jgi:hypothetical protein
MYYLKNENLCEPRRVRAADSVVTRSGRSEIRSRGEARVSALERSAGGSNAGRQ